MMSAQQTCAPGVQFLLYYLQQQGLDQRCSSLLSAVDNALPKNIQLRFYGATFVVNDIKLFPWCGTLTDLVCSHVNVDTIRACKLSSTTYRFSLTFPNTGSCSFDDASGSTAACARALPTGDSLAACKACSAASADAAAASASAPATCVNYTLQFKLTDNSRNTMTLNAALRGSAVVAVTFDDARSAVSTTLVSGSATVGDKNDLLQLTCINPPSTGCTVARKQYVVPLCMSSCAPDASCAFADLQRGVCPDQQACDSVCTATSPNYPLSDTCSATGGSEQQKCAAQSRSPMLACCKTAECSDVKCVPLVARTEQCSALENLINNHRPLLLTALNQYVMPLISQRMSNLALTSLTLPASNYQLVKTIVGNITQSC